MLHWDGQRGPQKYGWELARRLRMGNPYGVVDEVGSPRVHQHQVFYCFGT